MEIAKVKSFMALRKSQLIYSVLGFIDPNITVNVVSEEKIIRKIRLTLPEKVENVIRCKNPRCITSTETYIPHVFKLVDKTRGEYRCEYCDELIRAETVILR